MKRHLAYRNSAIVLIAALALAACSTMKIPGTGGTNQDQIAIDLATGLGSVGCAAFAIQAKPAEVTMVKGAVGVASNVLHGTAPTVDAIRAALQQANLPPQYVALAAIVIQTATTQLNNADVIPKDSVAYQVLTAFVGNCSVALGNPQAVRAAVRSTP